MDRSTFKRCLGLLIAGGLLTACAEQQAQQQRQAVFAAAMQQRNEEISSCQARFSESNKDAIARAKCLNAADAKMAPNTTYPDLASLVIAKRTELAEKQAAGKMTRAELVFQLNQTISQVVSEEQRRSAANSVAQSQANANNSLAAAMLLQSMQAARPAPYMIPTSPTLNTNCQTYGTNTSCQTR